MTVTGLQKATAVVGAFLDTHFLWLPRPAIKEDPDWTTAIYHATKDAIFIPHYTDSWNEGKPDILIHETGHVLAFNSDHPIEGFLAAMGADPALLQNGLINEVFAEHFARAYVDGYDGHNSPTLINVVPFDAAKMRAFCETLHAPVAAPQPPASTPRLMYDSTNPLDIPADAQMVAGYIDGIYQWPAGSWDRFPNAVKVPIAINVNTNDGIVGDVEWGDMTNQQAPVWAHMRRAAGADPTIYCSESNWPACRQAFIDADELEPHWWLAHYHVAPVIPDGAVAYQYANESDTGAHYDLSAVIDSWPEGGQMALDPVADAAQFREMFLKVYADIGVAALFDQMKAVEASLAAKDAADDARDATYTVHAHDLTAGKTSGPTQP